MPLIVDDAPSRAFALSTTPGVSGFSRTNPASVTKPNSRRVITVSLHGPAEAGHYVQESEVEHTVQQDRTRLLIQRKRIQRVAGGDEHVLAAVDQIRFGRVRHLAELRVPERLAVGRIERDEISGNVAAKQQLSSRCHQTGRRASAAAASELVPPHGL